MMPDTIALNDSGLKFLILVEFLGKFIFNFCSHAGHCDYLFTTWFTRPPR